MNPSDRPKNPKQACIWKAHRLWGDGATVSITSKRVSQKEASRLKKMNGTYLVECFVDGKLKASADHWRWNFAYRSLETRLERAYELESREPSR